ncbi:MAG: hypothetical protein KC431_21940, partial [Myxococcales bacterium]|nr:hypothetical protein [Myxococcales bacterium]
MDPTPPSLSLVIRLRAAVEAGWQVRCLDEQTGWLWLLEKGEQRRVFAGPTSALNDAGAARLANDKFYTGAVLAAAGFSVPQSMRCLRPGAFVLGDGEDPYAAQRGLAPALALAEACGLPLVVKPNAGSRGREVNLVEDHRALKEAIERIWTRDDLALVQRPIHGLDLRIDMLDGELLLAYLRRPLQLHGDGRSTALELARAVDPRLEQPGFRHKFLREPLWLRTLSAAFLEAEAVVPDGVTLDFPATILNLNR